MDREEKLLEASVDALGQRCQDLKNSIAAFIFKLEHEYETLHWPSFLDSFALISGQITNMMKVLRSEKTPAYRNRILLPLRLAPDRDEQLVALTEGRVQAFNHDMCPDYLRTKPDPEVDALERQLQAKAAQIPPDAAAKQITSSNKIVAQLLGGFSGLARPWLALVPVGCAAKLIRFLSSCFETGAEVVKVARENWETQQRANASGQTSSTADTQAIIAAISGGKGILDAVGGPKLPAQPAQQPGGAQRAGNKVPSAIKTNIKSASSASPYAR